MNVKYIGLTIGPIIKTLHMAKKTRETWAASYLFSFLMKTIIAQLAEKGIAKENILIPNTEAIEGTGNNISAGLFPDRLIFRAREGDFKKVIQAADAAMQIIAAGIANKIKAPENNVRQDLDQYLQIYFLEKDLEPDANPILQLSPFLDAIERHSKYIYHDENQFLARFLKLKKEDFLSQAAGLGRFESLIEIATRELKAVNQETYKDIIDKYIFNDGQDDDETSIIRAFKDNELLKKEFKIYHKYIAIVQADGDNIGNTIKKYGDQTGALQSFSRDLTAFARKAVLLIRDYGGAPVYAGGDDLLFFAPIIKRVNDQNGHISSKNIFDLIADLDTAFKTKFNEDATLSYGISITYYKYPMNEALDQARSLLFEKAKAYKGKNAAAFKILKHSGRSFETVFHKQSDIYSLFKRMLSQYSTNKLYLNSIVHSLQTYRGILKELFENVNDQAVERVNHFFANSFNEPVHDDHRPYINDAAELVYNVYQATPSTMNDEQKFQAVYAILRTLHFFSQDDNER